MTAEFCALFLSSSRSAKGSVNLNQHLSIFVRVLYVYNHSLSKSHFQLKSKELQVQNIESIENSFDRFTRIRMSFASKFIYTEDLSYDIPDKLDQPLIPQCNPWKFIHHALFQKVIKHKYTVFFKSYCLRYWIVEFCYWNDDTFTLIISGKKL